MSLLTKPVNLIKPTPEELKRRELLEILATLVKKYAENKTK